MVEAVAGGSRKRICRWCHLEIPASVRKDAKACSQKCRQTAWRLGRRLSTGDVSLRTSATGPLRFAYADPPYPGTAKRFYGKESTYDGEVDHFKLISDLTAYDRTRDSAAYDGWALSTSVRALRGLLPLCPPEARVCAWVKPGGTPPATYGLHGSWEALIVVPGRLLRPGHRDWLRAHPARLGGTLPGRKPLAFCAWLFQCLGMLPGDELVDLFPGTGIVGRAWAEVSRAGKGRRVAQVPELAT